MKFLNLKAFGVLLMVGLLAAATAAPVQADPPEIRTGLSAATYQIFFDHLVGQGYRLTQIAGYEVGGQARYNATWEQRGGPPWAARHGLSEGQFQQANAEMGQQGYQLLRYSRYNVGGQWLYAAIWEQS